MNSLRVNRVSVASCLVRLPVCVLALLSGALQLGAVTHVTLNGSATPTAADVAVTNVTVVGHGFPSGTIPPANVTVTLDPTTPGSGPSGTTTAKTVTVASGTTEYVTFLVPSSISVPTATSYQVSIAGTTSTGTAFASTNTAALTVNAPVSITTSTPLPQGDVNSNYSQALTATGGSGTYTWAVAAGTLPGNLSLNPTTGVICCMPSTAGTSHFEIKATDSLHLPSGKVFALTINPALVITTTSPLPAATVSAGYSQTFAASGGSGGGYTWSATGLPAWLSLSTAGALTGTPPLTAIDSTFTVTVTDSSNNSTSGSFSVPVTLAIITTSPLPTGQVGVNYSQTLTAIGGTGVYTWAPNAGSSLPGGLLLNATSGVLSGPPSTASAFNFTILVTDSNHATATQAFALTINPAASIQTLSPNSSNAGLSLQVSITGSYTHFVQGTTVANFGAGIAVGGAAEGQPGPVTVNSSTSATASIVIDPAAATGSQTVTVTTGAEQAAIVNGFTIGAAVTVINVETSTSTPIAPGFSGFDDEHSITGVEYYDPKFVAAVQALKPGWIRFPAGTPSMAFDWQAGHESQTWINELSAGTPPEVPTYTTQALDLAQKLTQAQGGIYFQDYANFLQAVGASGIVAFNSFTDTNTDSAANMIQAAQTAGVNIIEWELGNEAYFFPHLYATPAAYASAMYSPYYTQMIAANPAASIGLFFRGEYSGIVGNYAAWDNGMAAYSPQYWGAVSDHYYPITNLSLTTAQEEQTLNGLLVYGTSEYVNSYLLPLIGANTPLFITEFNQGSGTIPFQAYLYNGIFLAEFTARMSTVPNVKAVGSTALYLGNTYNEGIIRAVDDFQTYLLDQIAANPNYSTDTATDPNTQFSFYLSAPGLALEVLNLAVNNSTGIWPTTVTGSPTVPILGYDGNPVPAVFAQGYVGNGGVHYLVVTNKSGAAVPLGLEVNGTLLETTVTVSYVSNASDTAQNTATAQSDVQIVNTTSPNPITIGPYSVTRIQW